jgi:flagellar biosynthesis protein FliQ
MNATDIGLFLHDGMIVAMKLCSPILGVALVIGLFISFIQAITQINEATLAFLPKILAIGVALMMLGSFMTTTLTSFSHQIFDRIVTVGGL